MPTGRMTRLLVLTATLILLAPAPRTAASAQDLTANVPAVGMERRGWRDELRLLGEAIRRLADRSDDFAARLDEALDGSRHDGSRLEDRINSAAGEFRRAAGRMRNGFDELDYYRSGPDAHELLRVATRLERLIERGRLGGAVKADWDVFSQDLLIVVNAYNLDYARQGVAPARMGLSPISAGAAGKTRCERLAAGNAPASMEGSGRNEHYEDRSYRRQRAHRIEARKEAG